MMRTSDEAQLGLLSFLLLFLRYPIPCLARPQKCSKGDLFETTFFTGILICFDLVTLFLLLVLGAIFIHLYSFNSYNSDCYRVTSDILTPTEQLCICVQKHKSCKLGC